MADLQRGISQRELDRRWLSSGGRIVPVRRTGERRYITSDGRKSAPYSRRRKDASVRLLSFVRAALGEQRSNDTEKP